MGNRQIQQAPALFSAGQKYPAQLGLAGNLRELTLELTGALTDATNADSGIFPGDEWAIIPRMDIVVNGNDTPMSFSGRELWVMNHYWYNTNPQITATLGAGGANPSFDSVLKIPFSSPRCVSPNDTSLRTQNLQQLRLDVTWGSGAAAISSTASAFATAPALSISGYYDDTGFVPPLYRKIQKYQVQFAGAQTSALVQLTCSPQYRSILINTQSGTPLADDTAVLTAGAPIQLYSGSTVYYDFPVEQLRQGRNLSGGVPTDVDQTNASPQVAYQVQGFRNSKDNLRAWYYLDLCPDGQLIEAINTNGLPEFNLRFNVSKACTINILTEELFPLIIPGGSTGSQL